MSAEARLPQGAGFYDTDGQAILNMVQRTPEADRLATTLLIRHDATDLLEMLDLT